jgi:two-component system, NarL family, sensor histidine kinase UhpB
MPQAADDRALLDALLEYALAQLGADHVTFCAWDEAGASLTVVRCAGSLSHEELTPGDPIPIGELDSQVYSPANTEPRVYRADDPHTIPGVRTFLERVGAVSEITFPVVDHPGGRWVMEAFFCDPARAVGPAELEAGSRLAPLAAAAVSREALSIQLTHVETRFQTLVEQLPAITYIDRADGQPVYISPQVTALLGYPLEEWSASRDSWLSKVHPDDRARVRAQRVQKVDAGDMVSVEYRVVAADGRELWFYDQARVLTDEDGQPAFVQGVMLNITDRVRAEHALHESETRRMRVLEEMLRSEEAERARIATELHDHTIQVMTAALILLDGLERAAAAGAVEHLSGAIGKTRTTLAQAVERTRRMTFDLRPPLLETQGLGPALRDLADDAAVDGGVEVELDLRVGRHPFVIEDLAYRTVSEALANARRHSMATTVRISLTEQDDRLVGRVTDDGRGFDVGRESARSQLRVHLGLDAMRERVVLAGGRTDVQSSPGSGTTVAFEIPLRTPEPAITPVAAPSAPA